MVWTPPIRVGVGAGLPGLGRDEKGWVASRDWRGLAVNDIECRTEIAVQAGCQGLVLERPVPGVAGARGARAPGPGSESLGAVTVRSPVQAGPNMSYPDGGTLIVAKLRVRSTLAIGPTDPCCFPHTSFDDHLHCQPPRNGWPLNFHHQRGEMFAPTLPAPVAFR